MADWSPLYFKRPANIDNVDKRIETFVLYPQELLVNISAQDLANNGLFYTGTDSIVECFKCGIRYSNDVNGSALDRHNATTCASVQPVKQLVKTTHTALLKLENTRLKNSITCRQCNAERVQTLFLPCRHLVACETCSEKLDDCLLCDAKILGTVRTFLI